jgi:periplasmic protein TonB
MPGLASRGTGALVGSVVVHVLVLGTVALLRRDAAPELETYGVFAAEPLAVSMIDFAEVARAPAVPAATAPGDPIETVPGPADSVSAQPASPFPRADVDVPDRRAATQGGGGEGGPDTWTGRHDRETLRAQSWNDPDRYRLPRRKTGPTRAAEESIAQTPRPGFAQQAPQASRRARTGAEGGTPGNADELDPRWDDGGARAGDATRSATRLTEDGAVVVRREQPLVEDGPAATEAERRAPLVDDVDAAQASNERHPDALELTRPRQAGTAGEDVAGPRAGEGLSARSRRDQGGDGGTPADLPQANGGAASTRARLQDAYFRRLYARVQSRVAFPPNLAVGFEQGQVVVSFTLRTDGTVAEVRVARSSGYQEFDAAVITAVRDAAPFGRLPEAVRQGRESIKVRAPFEFDNPLIR